MTPHFPTTLPREELNMPSHRIDQMMVEDKAVPLDFLSAGAAVITFTRVLLISTIYVLERVCHTAYT